MNHKRHELLLSDPYVFKYFYNNLYFHEACGAEPAGPAVRDEHLEVEHLAVVRLQALGRRDHA